MHNKNPSVFWQWRDATEEAPAELTLEGVIAEESWFDDDVTPAKFREELEAHPGDVVVRISSPGGDVIAGSRIYTMLREHKGRVTVKVTGLAASAASVVVMAGDRVEISPTAYLMIHNAWTVALGNKADMAQAATQLEEIDKGIRTAYRLKTGLSDRRIAQMMDEETWMSSRTAVELGFADAIIGADPDEDEPDADEPEEPAEPEDPEDPDEDDPDEDKPEALTALPAVAWSARLQERALMQRMRFEGILKSASAGAGLRRKPEPEPDDEAPKSVPDDHLEEWQRLKLRLLSL